MVLSSLEIQRRVRTKACNFIKKETSAQVFYCELREIFKNTFSTEHPQTTASDFFWTSPDGCFCFSWKSINTARFSSTAMFFRSLKLVIWKKSVFYFYLHNKSTVLIPKWKVPKLSFRISYLLHFWYYYNVNFWCSTFFLYKWNVFKKVKTSLEAWFF